MCLDSFEKFETAHKAEDEAAKGLAGDTYQACGISCDVTKDEDACAAFKSVTETMCSKMGKETCEKLCDDGNGEKNDHACAALKSM